MSEQEAATEYVAATIASYQAALNAMAEAHTNVEWENRHEDAQKSLLLLEHFWTQKANQTLAAAAAQGPIAATLLGLVGKWLAWTKNDGERGLREREWRLALGG